MKNLTKTELERMIESANKKKFWIRMGKTQYRDYGNMIGIETRNYMVYWFEFDEDGRLMYSHAYNTNSGRYINGGRIGTNFKFKMIY